MIALIVLLIVVAGLGVTVGELHGYDRGVRETTALERLRAAFPLPRPMRRVTWRRP